MMLFKMGDSLPADSRRVAVHVDPGEGSPQKAYPPMSKTAPATRAGDFALSASFCPLPRLLLAPG